MRHSNHRINILRLTDGQTKLNGVVGSPLNKQRPTDGQTKLRPRDGQTKLNRVVGSPLNKRVY